ncbi:MAG TPA: FTR1 family protein [Bacillus sp. (in: firmicutes)]
MHIMIGKKRLCMILASFLFVFFLTSAAQAAEKSYDELFVYIGDSLMKAKSGDAKAISENMGLFESEWNAVKTDSELAHKVDERLLAVKNALEKDNNSEQIKQLLSSLSGSLVAYDAAQNPADKDKEKERLQALIPFIAEMEATIESGDAEKAKSQYQLLLNKWTEAEKIVREESIVSYGEIEKYMAFIRIAITKDPLDQERAKANLDALQGSVENFLSGNVKKANSSADYSLSDITQLLDRSEKSIEENNKNDAIQHLNEILTIWPMVEGDVSTRDSKLYSDIETKIPTAISLLDSKQVKKEEAQAIITDLNKRLLPLSHEISYSIWDASLILLREGLEALLIVATLLSFLKRVHQSDKQKWIWVGVAAGLAASIALSVIISFIFSQVSAATSREYLEGMIGIVAVVMMLTVGAWLHSKSNIHSWNRYIGDQMNQAIATGKLVSFALISFFSIFREGAETIIFYSGMAPYMGMKQLVIGIVIAIVILLVIGYIIIQYSVKMPITFFFKVATAIIYVLSFKILGVSLHALQVSQVLPTHMIYQIPLIEWIGLYPTLETTLPQIFFVILILLTSAWIKKKNSVGSTV